MKFNVILEIILFLHIIFRKSTILLCGYHIDDNTLLLLTVHKNNNVRWLRLEINETLALSSIEGLSM
ncbi:hypothetical protein HanIR_Chr13g0628121 [Helianthus annuus]|nr:hypothetical protein HanIR_Chr13g0628121 [Helianthus annuus]